MNRLRKLGSDSRGATLVEYIMLAGLVALICITAFTLFGGAIWNIVTKQKETTATINSSTGT